MNAQSDTLDLDALQFDNRYTRELPADPDTRNVRRQVLHASYSRVSPRPVARPQLFAYAREVAELLGLDAAACSGDTFARVFAGNDLLPGMDPYATCYGGHQFGTWAGQLGDGRAINLGEVRGRDGQHWTLQLKGAGPTPYSRTADGLAVLRSSLREFVCSEAMHHLGVPTTRALSLIGTGEEVVRDMFYDGHPRPEPGAVVCRVARSFTRFGHFEILAARDDIELLRRLADYTVAHDYPHLGAPSHEVYIAWFREVCERTAAMIVHWMRVGFVHGVMNTDNMSVLGETIDYGPYGWLEDYDPRWTPNTTDAGGRRYCFGNQPGIAQWNLVQLANALYPLIGQVQPLQDAVAHFAHCYERGWRDMMAAKLGLRGFEGADDEALFESLLEVLQLAEIDMSIFFRNLAGLVEAGDDATLLQPLRDAFYAEDLAPATAGRIAEWLRRYRQRVRTDNRDAGERRAQMDRVNPRYVPRNYLAQQAIDRVEAGDCAAVDELLEVLRRPYDEQPGKEAYAARRPEWARHRPGCSMLSCSS